MEGGGLYGHVWEPEGQRCLPTYKTEKIIWESPSQHAVQAPRVTEVMSWRVPHCPASGPHDQPGGGLSVRGLSFLEGGDEGTHALRLRWARYWSHGSEAGPVLPEGAGKDTGMKYLKS